LRKTASDFPEKRSYFTMLSELFKGWVRMWMRKTGDALLPVF